jgi:putative nucleotidyltransferase-like protein
MSRSLPAVSDTRRTKEDVEAIVARALHDPAASPPAAVGVDAAALVEIASHHRVLLLLGSSLRAAGTLEDWPADFVDAFQRAERGAVAVECVRHAELAMVLAALSAAGLNVVLFKGAALAYSRYPAPHVRVRADTDLLVASSEVQALESALQRLGYVRPDETSGRLVSYQSHHHKVDRYGVTHALDVHWRISNLQMLADRFTYEELWARRIPLAALGVSAVTIDDVHALLLALVHRAGHHPGSRNLLWLYDLHVLASRMTPEEMSQVQEIAGARGLGQIVADGLELARDRFGTARVGPVIDALHARAPRRDDAVVVQGPWTQAGVLRLDLDALPSWRARGRLILEHLVPSASYMRARYGIRSNVWLPGLYLWRVLHGAPKWLRRHETD